MMQWLIGIKYPKKITVLHSTNAVILLISGIILLVLLIKWDY